MALTQVRSDGIATGAVTATQIAADAVTVDDIADGSISTAKLADDAVTADKLANTAVTAGTYGSSSAIPAITVDAQGRITAASTNSVTQVGGANGVDFNDDVKARFGTGNDLEIFHDGSNSYIKDVGTGDLGILADNNVFIQNAAGTENKAKFYSNGAVQLYYDNSQRLATTSTGIEVTGEGWFEGGTVYQLNAKDANNTGTSAESGVAFRDSDNTIQARIGMVSSGNDIFYVFNERNSEVRFGTNGSGRCRVDANGHFTPIDNNTLDLGSNSERWRNVYTNDLNLSNEGGSNDVDGTWGSWTIQEGENDLFLLNRRNGKKYKFNLTEVS